MSDLVLPFDASAARDHFRVHSVPSYLDVAPLEQRIEMERRMDHRAVDLLSDEDVSTYVKMLDAGLHDEANSPFLETRKMM